MAKEVKDPAKRAELRRLAHAEAKLKAEAAKWDDKGTYLAKSTWLKPLSLSYRHEDERKGYVTRTLQPKESLTLKGYQLSEQMKGLAKATRPRQYKAALSLELQKEAADPTPSAPSKKPAKSKKKSKPEMTPKEISALETGADLPS